MTLYARVEVCAFGVSLEEADLGRGFLPAAKRTRKRTT